ncbi:MAG: FAD-dependent oxidoreductase [Erysipelotrichia bacterium]|jgi:thioredoxin reductase (NADPH)|nr:FAD-dependent oxidoreductase [Erysipelotrichia bacterium]
MMNKQIDVAIIGGGIAGITAGLYVKRSNLSVIAIDRNVFGGKLAKLGDIYNYPGFEAISGPELAYKLMEQAEKNGVELEYGNVLNVTKQDNGLFLVQTEEHFIEAKVVIIATGTIEKQLGIPGEKQFLNRGVSYCATCDGPLYRNKEVAVVGYLDTALDEAIYLSGIAKKVYLISKVRLEDIESSKLPNAIKRPNIDILAFSDVLSIKGTDHVESILVSNLETNNEQEIKVSAVFPYIGQKTLTEFLANLKVETRNGYLVVSKDMETNVPGLLAAGDTIDKKLRQLVTAAGDGCIAAATAIRYIKVRK